jgi:hypothetical protein
MLNWNGLGNLIGSAVAAGGAGFLAAKQSGASDEQAGSAAGVAAITAIIQHLRMVPTVRTGP